MSIWVLGDQLNDSVGPLADADPGEDRVVMIEAHGFARRKPYHPRKLAMLFAAMRHFRDRLRDAGHDVAYYRAETFGEGLREHFSAHPDDELVVMCPPSHGAADRFAELVADARARPGEGDGAGDGPSGGEAADGDGEDGTDGGDGEDGTDSDGGTDGLRVVGNDLFLCSPAEFDRWAGDTDGYRHEDFYRWMRRETGYLMDGGDPVGGEWNYDGDNRETPPGGYEAPDPPTFGGDELTRETRAWVDREFDGWGAPASEGAFHWPVTREGALDALDGFVDRRLAEFGPYQDAMVGGEWAMNHALLGAAINLGLLHPREAVEAAIDAYEAGEAPINSVEGFVRQVIGWREFVRHVYRREMPDLATANQLDEREDLPPLYAAGDASPAGVGVAPAGDGSADPGDTPVDGPGAGDSGGDGPTADGPTGDDPDADRPTAGPASLDEFADGEGTGGPDGSGVPADADAADTGPVDADMADTDMECLSQAVGSVWEHGYSHHIQRLMVLSNFALIYGVEPRQLNEWFHYAYVDAYHWVTTPNVVEMGMYGAGAFATKPYAASANYVNRMSDHCSSCPYYHTKTTGEGACPFNALYWDFLARNEDDLRSNHRMGLMYGHVDDKREAGDMAEIRDRAEEVRRMARDGEL